MTYADKLKDPRWQRKRLAIMERDNFTCRDCRATDKHLHVHHCFYEKGGPWDTRDELLITVCDECHETRQKWEDAARMSLARMFTRLSLEELEDLAFDAISVAANPDVTPKVTDTFEFEFQGNIRWYWEACRRPELRAIYDEVTGAKTDWERIDAEGAYK